MRALANVTLTMVGGIVGNLIAAWITDAWQNVFTAPRVIGMLLGLVVVVALLVLVERGSKAVPDSRSRDLPEGKVVFTCTSVQSIIQSFSGGSAMPTAPLQITAQFEILNQRAESVTVDSPRVTGVDADSPGFGLAPERVQSRRADQGFNSRITWPLQLSGRYRDPFVVVLFDFPVTDTDPGTFATHVSALTRFDLSLEWRYRGIDDLPATEIVAVSVPIDAVKAQLRRYWAGSTRPDLADVVKPAR